MVAPPRLSYLIWFSQRVGSTVLAQTLEDTGIAGRPREWFNDDVGAGILAKHRVTSACELREVLWRDATTANGVLGVKYGMRAALHRELTSLFAGAIPDEPDPDGRRAWDAFLPGCKHVFMTRRNKVRLAVSWWRAITSHEWHRPASGPAPPPLPDVYDRGAIEHLLIEANLREADMQEQFDRWGVVPHTIVYEDFIARREPTVRALLEFLEIPERDGIAIPAPALARMADEVSDAWCERYGREWAPR